MELPDLTELIQLAISLREVRDRIEGNDSAAINRQNGNIVKDT
jgi:hypothetical protein